MVLWEHPAERYLALASLVVIALSLGILAGKRLTEPPPLVLETPPAKPTPPLSLKVHIKGAVQKPGVYAFPFGSRVEEAVKKALPRTDADLNALNLAAFLEDGQELFVPSVKAAPRTPLSLAPSTPVLSSSPQTRQNTSRPSVVRLNTATESELVRLPGIGPSLARRILEYRRQKGGFKSVDELLEVKGIGPKKLEQIRPYVQP